MRCCWDNSTTEAPHCYHSYPSKTGHVIGHEQLLCDVSDGSVLKGKRIQMILDPKLEAFPAGHYSLRKKYRVTLGYVSKEILQVEIDPTESVPKERFFRLDTFLDRNKMSNTSECREAQVHPEDDMKYQVAVSNQNEPFAIKVIRKSSGTAVFSTDWMPLLFHEQFLELTTFLPSWNVYGLGEDPRVNLKHDLRVRRKWPLFSRDRERYGAHPFYLCLENDGKANGVLVSSANAMDVTVGPAPSITFRSTGSSLMLHVFLGPTPDHVIGQLTDIVGRPSLPPFWALGRHDCRMEGPKYNATGPFESVCLSLEEVDKGMARAEKKVMLTESPVFQSVNLAQDKDVFVLSKERYYFDSFRSSAVDWLSKRYAQLSDRFHGLMLIDNSPINFVTRENCTKNSMNQPPYNPLGKESLSNRTMCMDACHQTDNCSESLAFHYNLHNIYGMKHAQSAYTALNEIQKEKRPFLTSLSTFTGSGQFGGHWGGKPRGTWTELQVALVRSLEFNMYGIPMTGSPVCGFSGVLDSLTLCLRWWELASLQPLLITYRERTYEFESDANLNSSITELINIRYSLLPYLYTLLYNANITGAPVVRPLFMEFYNDANLYDISSQFLLGSGLLVSPNLTPGNNQTFVAYVPEGCWYNYFSGIQEFPRNRGHLDDFTTMEGYANMNIRGGHIIPRRKGKLERVEETLKNPVEVLVALECLSRFVERTVVTVAKGDLFVDDGVSTLESKRHFLLQMTTTRNNLGENPKKYYSLHFRTQPDDAEAAAKLTPMDTNLFLDIVFILGQRDEPVSCQMEVPRVAPVNFTYDEIKSILTLRDFTWDIREAHEIKCQFY